MRRGDVTAWLAGGITVGVLGLDWVLLRKKKRPFTKFINDNRTLILAGEALIHLHAYDMLGPIDPFKLLGRLTGIHSPQDAERVIEEIVQESLDTMIPS